MYRAESTHRVLLGGNVREEGSQRKQEEGKVKYALNNSSTVPHATILNWFNYIILYI